MAVKVRELKLGFLNINGFNDDKISDKLFVNKLEKYDIVFLIETWHNEATFNSFSFPQYLRPSKFIEKSYL